MSAVLEVSRSPAKPGSLGKTPPDFTYFLSAHCLTFLDMKSLRARYTVGAQ